MRHESIYDCEDTVHVEVFRVMKLCHLVRVHKNFREKGRILHLKCRMQSVEDESRIFLRKAVYTVSKSKISRFKHLHIRLQVLRMVNHSADIYTQ
jgi:hypothetical protein